MGKRGYLFPLSMPIFSCKKNNVAKEVEKSLDEFHLQSLPARDNFDSKGYVNQYLYGTKSYMHKLGIENFWEDCFDDNEVCKKSFMRLTLQKIPPFGISFNILDNAEENEVTVDPKYHTLAIKTPPKIDWTKNKVLDLMVCIAPNLRRTSDWLNGKWGQNVNPSQEKTISAQKEERVTSTTTINVSIGKSATKSPSQNS